MEKGARGRAASPLEVVEVGNGDTLKWYKMTIDGDGSSSQLRSAAAANSVVDRRSSILGDCQNLHFLRVSGRTLQREGIMHFGILEVVIGLLGE
jgi:hypothetical protein